LVKFRIFYITPMPGSDWQLPRDGVDIITPSHKLRYHELFILSNASTTLINVNIIVIIFQAHKHEDAGIIHWIKQKCTTAIAGCQRCPGKRPRFPFA